MTDDLTLLTLVLDKVWYAIDVQVVQEVVPLPELTPLSDAPPYISGIFNLRGRIVTTIDLGQRLGLKPRSWNTKTSVLVTLFQEKFYGLIVDEALSLIRLSTQDMERRPDLSSGKGKEQNYCVIGVGKLGGRLIPILDLKRILTVAEQQASDVQPAKQAQGDRQ